MDIIQEKNQSGAVTANYIRTLNIDEPLTRIKADGTVRHYVKDALGSIIALTDDSGVVKTTYSYDPFGNTTISGESSDNPFQYTGRENDNTGLYYYRARYYSPELQRFISEDPLKCERDGGMNLYRYAVNNPVNWMDPSGTNIYGNWCGPGGRGPTIDAIDKCCYNHDMCYKKKGTTWKDQICGDGDADCDKELCKCLKKVRIKNFDQLVGQQKIMWYFNCGSSSKGHTAF